MRTLPRSLPLAALCVALTASTALLASPRAGAASRPTDRAARQIVRPATVAAGVAAGTPAATGAPKRLGARAASVAHPVDPTVRQYAVRGVSRTGLAALSKTMTRQAWSYAALTSPVPASGVAVTGVTWKGTAPAGLAMAVRTRTQGAWSGWTSMVYDSQHGPTPGSGEARRATRRTGTDPLVLGRVDAVQLRVETRAGRVPAGMSLSVINPGSSPADAPPVVSSEPDATGGAVAPTATQKAPTAARTAPGSLGSLGSPDSTSAAVDGRTRSGAQLTNTALPVHSATPQPVIYSRADWGADESMRGCCTQYGTIHLGFIHHTVNSNNYSRGEVPAIIRGIYAYHTQSLGWRDIAYNFLVDRFGRIWEGRYGGISLPIIGAHTYGYNEVAFGASAIGNFEEVLPSASMLDSFARLEAWKLSLEGIRPRTKQSPLGVTLNAISGHRDVYSTACPGRYLYAKIPGVIRQAAAYQHPFGGRDLQHSFVNSPTPDALLVSTATGGVAYASGTGAPGFQPTSVAVPGFTGHSETSAVQDVTGDGRNDVMARDTATGVTSVYPGTGHGTFGTPLELSQRWSGTSLFAGPGDVNGDGKPDVVARDDATGQLLLYPGRGNGHFGNASVAVRSFGGYTALSAAGDFNGDGRNDLLALGRNGVLAVLLGDGNGSFPDSITLAKNWGGTDLLAGGVDVTGDARPDVVARDASTKVASVYANIGGDALSPAVERLPGQGRSLSLSHDLTGQRLPDVVSLSVSGDLTVTPSLRQNWLSPVRAHGDTWPGMNRVMVVGDWNGDGYVDAMARQASTGTLWLYPGDSSGGFGAPVGGWSGWGMRTMVTPVGDFNGDGRPDLMAQGANGKIYLYPGRGFQGFGRKIIMRHAFPAGSVLVAASRWNQDGAPDVIVRTSSGEMKLYPGDGPGRLGKPVTIARGYSRYGTLLGVGDLTGDGQPDFLGRTPNGVVWLIPGLAPGSSLPDGGLGNRRYVGAGYFGYLLG